MRSLLPVLTVLPLVLPVACADLSADGRAREIHRVLDIADARPVAADSVAILLEALRATDAEVRVHAARSIGRLERPVHVPDLLPLLGDRAASVRAEAANALGQSVHGSDATAVRPLLLERLGTESDDYVRGVLAHTLGRLRSDSAAAATVALTLADALPSAGPLGRPEFARGFYHLMRQPAARVGIPAPAVEALRGLATEAGDTESARRTRTLATAALAAVQALDGDDLERALADPEPLVRREAIASLGRRVDGARATLIAGLADPSPAVRYEALRVLGAGGAACAEVDRMADDESAHVALLAIDLAAACPATPARIARLEAEAGGLPDGGAGWHRAAHALRALAELARDRVGGHLPDFVGHESPFVRAWAARSAAGHTAILRSLVEDADANVRIAALTTLAATDPAAARAAAASAVADAEGELAMVAAGVLEGADPAVVPTLFDTLDRLSALRQQTARDPRTALLTRISELGGPSDTARLADYVRDFDPVVAAQAATILSGWTGSEVQPQPQPLAREAFPMVETLERLAVDTVVITMADDARIRIVLFPWLAPTNAARFARLADEGWYDGLTLHRVVPNFVVQGGSPGANEYLGAPAYSRDELGLQGNWRGTVGLSTRGRDTGDAQLYVNLIDNSRLDHDYTVFGQIVEGMAVVDGMLEGARMRSVRSSTAR